MDINRGIYLVVEHLELVKYHDHVLHLKGVNPLVSQRLVGAWSMFFVGHDVFLMLVSRELVWN